MVIRLFNFKDPDTPYKYFDSVQHFTEPCPSVMLILNTLKIKELVVDWPLSLVEN